jgi:hypothetical protein
VDASRFDTRTDRPSSARLLGAALVFVLAPVGLAAQHAGHPAAATSADSIPRLHVMAQAVPIVTRASTVPPGGARTDAALTQTVVMTRAAALRGRVALDLTLDAEGVTMPGGELSLGAFGEGFVDRRHPHTYLHEAVVSGFAAAGPVRLSASLGRGFAPFGTDDPMMRPFVKYPVNHHLAQILERGVAIAAARAGRVILEAATFTGEEPTSPSSLPMASRFGDSWSARGTLLPVDWAELQVSHARVTSPEMTNGFGLNQRKWSASARGTTRDGSRYALVEWARTVEHDHLRGEDAFSYETLLGEGAVRAGPLGVALRIEQTDRPEEQRSDHDSFRSARPHTDLSILGITRWRTATLHVAAPAVTQGTVTGVLFVEISRLAAAPRDPQALFVPVTFYGDSRFWMLTTGVRLRAGGSHDRMGRYGVANP